MIEIGMQGNNPGQGNSGNSNPKQSGLSWAQPVASTPATTTSKPAATVSAAPAKAPATAASNSKAAKATAAQNSSNSMRTFGLVGGGVVVAGLLIWGLTSLAPSAQNEGVVAEEDSDTTALNDTSVGGGDMVIQNISSAGIGRSASASFTAGTQEAGSQVVVSISKVSAPTWLVVYEMQGGNPMWVLGAGMVFPESSGQVAISLLRPTKAGETYLIAQSPDTGDDHLFTRGQDVPLRDSGGKLLGISFSTR